MKKHEAKANRGKDSDEMVVQTSTGDQDMQPGKEIPETPRK